MLAGMLKTVFLAEGPSFFARQFERRVVLLELPHAHLRWAGPVAGLFMRSELDDAEAALKGLGHRDVLNRGIRRAAVANQGNGGWRHGGCPICKLPLHAGEECPRCPTKS